MRRHPTLGILGSKPRMPSIAQMMKQAEESSEIESKRLASKAKRGRKLKVRRKGKAG